MTMATQKGKMFEKWFTEQHGPRPSKKTLTDLIRERNELSGSANRASRLVEHCKQWEDRRTSALWAWQASQIMEGES